MGRAQDLATQDRGEGRSASTCCPYLGSGGAGCREAMAAAAAERREQWGSGLREGFLWARRVGRLAGLSQISWEVLVWPNMHHIVGFRPIICSVGFELNWGLYCSIMVYGPSLLFFPRGLRTSNLNHSPARLLLSKKNSRLFQVDKSKCKLKRTKCYVQKRKRPRCQRHGE
jgi:hypothetical protein